MRWGQLGVIQDDLETEGKRGVDSNNVTTMIKIQLASDRIELGKLIYSAISPSSASFSLSVIRIRPLHK